MDEALAIAGRVAIVTGAGNGLGRAESLALARAGALLVLNDLPGDAVQEVAAEIAAAGGQAVVAAGDVAEWSTGEQLLATALERYGRLDILVNNAGVLRDRMVFTMSEQEWDLVIRVHLRGHFVTTRLATAYWREQRNAAGHPVYARIVNTSSEAFLLGSAGQPNYAAAKAGIAALTVTTARSCSRYGVRANAICPRARTAMTAELMGPAPAGAVDPLAPEHVAPLVVYLASPAAETINGEVFVVHGGVAAVMDPPRVRSVFRASGTPDGMWTLDSVAAALGPAFGDRAPSVGFLCEDTLELATETRYSYSGRLFRDGLQMRVERFALNKPGIGDPERITAFDGKLVQTLYRDKERRQGSVLSIEQAKLNPAAKPLIFSSSSSTGGRRRR